MRVEQGGDGTLYLVQGSNDWTLVPNPITDSELAALAPSGELDGAIPAAFLGTSGSPSGVQVTQASEGTLYLVQGSNVWTLVPDQIGDTDVSALTSVGELDGTISAVIVGSPIAAPAEATTAPATAAPAPVAPTPTAVPAPPTILQFASDPTWTVYTSDPATGAAKALGPAERVCVSALVPSPCPAGATLYGAPYPGWGAPLATIPGANWVWAPASARQTSPVDLVQFFFARTFAPPTTPTAASISVAADDFAEVRVNGKVVGSTGSITDVAAAARSQNALATFDLVSFLVAGQNTLTIRGQSGPSSYAGCAVRCTYAQNTAGVVFGGAISFTH